MQTPNTCGPGPAGHRRACECAQTWTRDDGWADGGWGERVGDTGHRKGTGKVPLARGREGHDFRRVGPRVLPRLHACAKEQEHRGGREREFLFIKGALDRSTCLGHA